MIARRWRGWAEGQANADAYEAHFESAVRPQLERTDGFLGATLERVEGADGRTEIVVVTRWASMEAIRAFAGDDVGVAVVEPAARAMLAGFDPQARHIELRDDDVHGHLELIDIGAEAAAHEPWFNATLTTANDAWYAWESSKVSSTGTSTATSKRTLNGHPRPPAGIHRPPRRRSIGRAPRAARRS